MDEKFTLNCMHIPFCKYLNIEDERLIVAIEIIFIHTDIKNYLDIASSASKIKNILSTAKIAANKNEILNAIAKSLGYSNHHEMKSKTYPNIEQLNKILTQNVHEIFRKYGIKGLLPQKLPEHILKSCSYTYHAYQNLDEEINISGLFSIIMLILLEDKTPEASRELHLDMTLKELDTYLHTYGISIHLEDLQRMGFISMPKNTLPTVENILDSHKKREVIFNHDYINS